MSVENIEKDLAQKMHQRVEIFQNVLNKIRAGRPHPGILDSIKVEYYGQLTPLNQLASIAITDGLNLVVSPWEKNMIPEIEKALRNSDQGFNPTTQADLIRVPVPPLSEQTRREHARRVAREAEAARVAVRNLRRDANQSLKSGVKNKEISEDIERRLQTAIQKLTDEKIAEIGQMAEKKEADLMEI